MRVIVLGGGVIGTSTAWYLAQAGHEVRVVERQAAVSRETSFANAGQVSPGYASPWAAPGVPLKALRWMFQKHAPLAIRPQWDWAQYRWMWQLLQNCNAASYARNKARMVRLSEYSRDCLDRLRADIGIDYEGRQQGTLQLFRTPQQLAAAAKDIGVLEQFGVPYQLLDPSGLLAYEPALSQMGAGLVGGLRLPNDQTGDCELFTRRLAEHARAAGVEFQYRATVQHLEASSGAIDGVWIDGQRETADAYVLALGSYSPALLAPLGIGLPVYPLKGYSLTVPIVDPERAPVSTILDETYKIAVTRFDDRIRVGGMAELAGFDMTLRPARRATLEQVVSELYPAAGDLGRASFWTGLRPATPDGTPLVGNSGYRRLYLNTGHGTLGWTMACGSGQYLSDLISGRRPAIDGEGLDLRRYG